MTLGAGIPLALAVIGWSALSGFAWVGQGSYPVSLRLPGHYRTLRVEADAGAVSLRLGTGISVSGTGLSSSNVTATGHSGDITLVFTRVPDSVTVTDFSGSIRIVLPAGPTAYQIHASTHSGRTAVTRPHRLYLAARHHGNRRIR